MMLVVINNLAGFSTGTSEDVVRQHSDRKVGTESDGTAWTCLWEII